MSDLYVTLGSAAAVLIMAAIAYALGFRQPARIADEAALRALIAEAEPNARIANAYVDQRGRAGLAELADSRWAAAVAIGDRIALRVFAHADIRRDGAKLRARFSDAGFPDLTLRLAP